MLERRLPARVKHGATTLARRVGPKRGIIAAGVMAAAIGVGLVVRRLRRLRSGHEPRTGLSRHTGEVRQAVGVA
jgi:hypothetical protein